MRETDSHDGDHRDPIPDHSSDNIGFAVEKDGTKTAVTLAF
jgi:hypothetical protein